MHACLLSIGFIKLQNNTYVNYEINVVVRLLKDDALEVVRDEGNVEATLEELENAIVSGGFGEY